MHRYALAAAGGDGDGSGPLAEQLWEVGLGASRPNARRAQGPAAARLRVSLRASLRGPGHVRPSIRPSLRGHQEEPAAPTFSYAGGMEERQHRARPRAAIEQIGFAGSLRRSREVGYGGLDAPAAVLLCAAPANLGTS